jgi:DNA-directed RNA polymerase subunit RPC12/RpoP
MDNSGVYIGTLVTVSQRSNNYFCQKISSRLLSKTVKIIIHKISILHVVLYGCETCSRILREEHRLRVFEIRVVRKIFV